MEEVGTTAEEFRREEERVKGRSAVFRKELGLADLVLTQIVFVVGTIWVGTAAKLGGQQLFFWLLAIVTFYLPLAAVVIYLNRLMPLEGGLYQWAKLSLGEFVGFMNERKLTGMDRIYRIRNFKSEIFNSYPAHPVHPC